MAESITCPVCGMTSWNPNDVREGYCGNCNDWTAITTQCLALPSGAWAQVSPDAPASLLTALERVVEAVRADPSIFVGQPSPEYLQAMVRAIDEWSGEWPDDPTEYPAELRHRFWPSGALDGGREQCAVCDLDAAHDAHKGYRRHPDLGRSSSDGGEG